MLENLSQTTLFHKLISLLLLLRRVLEQTKLESVGLAADALRLDKDQRSRSLTGEKSIDDQVLLDGGSKENIFLPHVQTVKSNMPGKMAEVSNVTTWRVEDVQRYTYTPRRYSNYCMSSCTLHSNTAM